MATSGTTAAGGRPIRIAFTPVALILFVLGIGLTAWPSRRVGVAIAGLAFLWIGGTFFLASALWAALGFGFPASFNRWPMDEAAASTGGALPAATLTDEIGAGGPTGVYAARL
jgi:hypothetical protein